MKANKEDERDKQESEIKKKMKKDFEKEKENYRKRMVFHEFEVIFKLI